MLIEHITSIADYFSDGHMVAIFLITAVLSFTKFLIIIILFLRTARIGDYDEVIIKIGRRQITLRRDVAQYEKLHLEQVEQMRKQIEEVEEETKAGIQAEYYKDLYLSKIKK